MHSQPSPSPLVWRDLWPTLSSPDALCAQHTLLSAAGSLTPFPLLSESCWALSALWEEITHIIPFQRGSVTKAKTLESRGENTKLQILQNSKILVQCKLAESPPASSCLHLWVSDCASALSSEIWQSMAFRSASFTSLNWAWGTD